MGDDPVSRHPIQSIPFVRQCYPRCMLKLSLFLQLFRRGRVRTGHLQVPPATDLSLSLTDLGHRHQRDSAQQGTPLHRIASWLPCQRH